MPAEWEPHEATWIAWPHNRDDWPGRFAPIPWVYGEIVRKLSRVEKVRILVSGARAGAPGPRCARQGGRGDGGRRVFRMPHGPRVDARLLPAVRQASPRQVALTKWRFNGWAKYDDKLDAAGRTFVAERFGCAAWTPEMVLEGGSIDVNGDGLLLTTEECLLSDVQARNPGMTRARDRAQLARLSRRRQRDLAAQRHRRRRHPRSR